MNCPRCEALEAQLRKAADGLVTLRDHLLKTCDVAERAGKATLEALDDLTDLVNTIKAATDENCTCGGGGPGDPGTCPACEIYHELVAWLNKHNPDQGLLDYGVPVKKVETGKETP